MELALWLFAAGVIAWWVEKGLDKIVGEIQEGRALAETLNGDLKLRLEELAQAKEEMKYEFKYMRRGFGFTDIKLDALGKDCGGAEFERARRECDQIKAQPLQEL